MIFFIILFLAILAVSFYLAYHSMKDVADFPDIGSSPFLIRNPASFSEQLLSDLHQKMSSGQIISFERLFKGSRSALVIYGSKMLLQQFPNLDLLELEDYSKAKRAHLIGWETTKTLTTHNLKLAEDEELWLQFVCQRVAKNFSVQKRIILISADIRKKQLLDNTKSKKTNQALLRDYTHRSIAPVGKYATKVSPEKLVEFILPPLQLPQSAQVGPD